MTNVYKVITDRIIAKLEKGTVPWHKPWKGSSNAPKNLVSQKEYRGMNVFVLASGGFESPWWISYRQAREHGGHVKKGAQGFPVLYWNWAARHKHLESSPDDVDHVARAARSKAPFVRYYTVFNVEQTEGVDYPPIENAKSNYPPLEICEQVVQGYRDPPKIQRIYAYAFYLPLEDVVGMPKPERFDRAEDFYSTLFHELSHSTGHQSRLARRGIMERAVFASNDYSKEELVAEMGAAFLCGHCGIGSRTLDKSASYIDNWLGRLRNDKRLVIEAASQAQRSADYILNRVFDTQEERHESTVQIEEGEGV